MSWKPRREQLQEDYLDAAEKAAEAERTGNYQKAYGLWMDTKRLALTLKQREWCETRASYCYTWQGKREARDASES